MGQLRNQGLIGDIGLIIIPVRRTTKDGPLGSARFQYPELLGVVGGNRKLPVQLPVCLLHRAIFLI